MVVIGVAVGRDSLRRSRDIGRSSTGQRCELIRQGFEVSSDLAVPNKAIGHVQVHRADNLRGIPRDQEIAAYTRN